MDRILAQISNQLDTCSGGGGGTCGNGGLDPGEQCDGSNLDGQTCQSLGFGGGTLACSNCAFDTSRCCKSVNQACTGNSQCCSGKCSGKAGRKTCR
jgi:hypothetical protein